MGINAFATEVYTEGYSKKPRTNLNSWFKKCPVCGKEFHVANECEYPLKAYTKKGSFVYFEKPSCLYKYQAKLEMKIKRRKHISAEALARYEQRRMEKIEKYGKPFWQDWQNGMTMKKIAEKYQCPLRFVYRWIHAYREVTAL